MQDVLKSESNPVSLLNKNLDEELIVKFRELFTNLSEIRQILFKTMLFKNSSTFVRSAIIEDLEKDEDNK